MPGILPMKVIKVGSSAQSRIAQACDRCRSKKIRCDGIRPCCTQCANVGFECKTSDKLSRRAFPRGYTESLEERVRSLEAEVRELKDLLDEKDEKIDILSKMHSNSNTSSNSSPRRDSLGGDREDLFRVQASPLLFDSEDSDSYFMGASSGRAFVDAFKRKIQETGMSCASINTDGFLTLHGDALKKSVMPIPDESLVPPRMFTDRMVNIFFQEWAPLFPVLHKPTFLHLYEQFVEKPEQVTHQHKLAQLYLVFGISALSSELVDREQLSLCEVRWRMALDALVMDNTLVTLQCMVLAQLFCIAKGDYKCLQHYKAIAVGMSHRLGLHQNQKRFSFGALTIETRKRVFWSLYTVDCFSAAALGLPKLLTEADVYAEYPTDIDDEYVMEKGFQPTLPGESTKISSALALFRLSRILSNVLAKNYPAATTHDLSLSSIGALEQELNDWLTNLPSHLKFTFIQDKPSAVVTGNRSPLLSLTFYYIRALVHRPVIGSCPSTKSSSSVMALAESSKRVIQIAQLLKERHLAFSLCLNKDEVLVLCGLSLLYQRLELKQDGKLMRDGQEQVQEVIKSLAISKPPCASDFTKLAIYMGVEDPMGPKAAVLTGIPVPQNPTLPPSPTVAKNHRTQEASNNLGHLASDVTHSSEHQRRATISTTASMSQVINISPSGLSNHNNSDDYSEINTDPSNLGSHQYHQQSASPPQSTHVLPQNSADTQPESPRTRTRRPTNLDYLSLSSGPSSRSRTTSPIQSRKSIPIPPHTKDQNTTRRPSSGWENIFGSGSSVDESQIYDAMYGGTSLPLSLSTVFSSTIEEKATPGKIVDESGSGHGWTPEWDVASLTMHHFDKGVREGEGDGGPSSVLSFSEESLSSVEAGEEGTGMDYDSIMLMAGHDGLRGW